MTKEQRALADLFKMIKNYNAIQEEPMHHYEVKYNGDEVVLKTYDNNGEPVRDIVSLDKVNYTRGVNRIRELANKIYKEALRV